MSKEIINVTKTNGVGGACNGAPDPKKKLIRFLESLPLPESQREFMIRGVQVCSQEDAVRLEQQLLAMEEDVAVAVRDLEAELGLDQPRSRGVQNGKAPAP